jgi:hypothetical protein
MSGATRVGLALLAAGVVLGIAGDALLRATPLGLNVPVWAALFAATALALERWRRPRPDRRREWLLGVALVFAALLVWRDSTWLAALDLVGVFTALSLALVRVPAFRVRRTDLAELTDGAVSTVSGAVGGAAVTLFEDIRWREIPRGDHSPHVAAATRGVAFALPLLLVFGGLFIAADAAFEHIVRGLAPSDAQSIASHAALTVVVAWLAVGLLRQFLRPAGEGATLPRARVGPVEIGLVLTLIDLLFLAFVLVQLRYLFGGAGRVEREIGLTYAEYARRGFFELVVVAALALGLLLVTGWALRRDGRAVWAFRVPGAILVVLVFVVMASALQRMRLYQDAYGLTELRVYASAFMVWLAALFLWAAVTVLRGRSRAFAAGALATGFAAVLALNAVNPDSLIARTNVDRALAGRSSLDARYLARLSDDAVPQLVAVLPRLDREGQQVLAANLLARDFNGDWRMWNLARSRAARIVREHRAELTQYAEPLPG